MSVGTATTMTAALAIALVGCVSSTPFPTCDGKATSEVYSPPLSKLHPRTPIQEIALEWCYKGKECSYKPPFTFGPCWSVARTRACRRVLRRTSEGWSVAHDPKNGAWGVPPGGSGLNVSRIAFLVADAEKLWRISDHDALADLLAPVDTPLEAALLAVYGVDPWITMRFRCGVPNAQRVVGGGYVLQLESDGGGSRTFVRVGRDGEVRTDSLPFGTSHAPYVPLQWIR